MTIVSDLRYRVGELPRCSLGLFPTPLHDLERLSESLGGKVRILIKRDDQAGLAFGGNKVRVLEFTVGQALAEGSDCLVAAAYAHSNHCRQAAAAAAKVGLDAYLILRAGIHSDGWRGNLLIDSLLGAKISLIEASGIPEVLVAAESRIAELRAEGRRPFLLTLRPEMRVLGTVAGLTCLLEIVEQLEAMAVRSPIIYVTSASATYAGMLLGAGLTDSVHRVVGISPDGTIATQIPYVEWLMAGATERLRFEPRSPLHPPIEIDDEFVAPGYGLTSALAADAIQLAARTEGLLLDPVYTGKGMAGLIDHVRSGRVPVGSTVVFVHTGGLPNLFAYGGDLELPPFPMPRPRSQSRLDHA